MDWLVTELVVRQVTRLAGEQGSLLWWSDEGLVSDDWQVDIEGAMDWLVTELVVGQVTRLAGEQGSLLWWSEGGGGLEDGFAGSVLLCCGGVGGEEEGAAGGASFLVVILQGVSGESLRGDAFGSEFSDE